MQYALTSTNKEKFSLHDCKATQILINDHKLIFFFPDGIYFEDYLDDWPNTKEAEVEYLINYNITFYLFENKDGYDIRKEYKIEEVAEKINNKEWELEFAYQYDGYKEVFHTGYIWQNKEPWSYDCQLFISFENVIYRWNLPKENIDEI